MLRATFSAAGGGVLALLGARGADASGQPSCEPYCPGPSSPGPNSPGYSHGRCPIDALKLRVCANVLDPVHAGRPQYQECCPLLDGLVDLEAALCLCTAIKANVLGIHLDVPTSLNLIMNKCGKSVPEDFTCPQ